MSKKLSTALSLLVSTTAFGWAAACSTSTGGSPDGGSPGSSSSSSSSSSSGGGEAGGSSSGGAPHDSGLDAESGGLGLLVDNMTAPKGTQVSLVVPAGETAGSYYAYADGPLSLTMSTMQLADVPVTPNIVNADGSQIVGELCFGGSVAAFAGLGMNLVYATSPDAEAGALSSPTPFDASQYHGVSFYIHLDLSDGPSPSVHFGIPDTQTADKAAYPASLCNVDGGTCDDDFGSNVALTAGVWTKVAFQWADLGQIGFGSAFTGLKTSQLIGMKWQVNGSGGDAAAETFNFCISDIYFTP